MEVSDFVRMLLQKRGIESDADIAAFLSPDYEAQTHDPFLIQGIQKAVDRLLHAMHSGEKIAVYADFDCDGIPGAAVLSDFFNKVGFTNFEVYFPHRDREGYGFHKEAIDTLRARGVSLIITVDVGTVAVEAVAHAQNIGIDVIVTDHHEILPAQAGVRELPNAFAILNPKLGTYPFRNLCGAGMAFKLVQATLCEGKKRRIESFTAIPNGWEKWLLDLVAIATVADMVPLVGENRALVFFGLQVLRKSPRPGISALCNMTRLRKHEITETDIGFSIGPRINAASRMGEPDLGFKLLTTKDAQEAEMIAAHLEELNTKRKSASGVIVREAKRRVKERALDETVVVLGNPEWKPALLGLAANSIMGERGGVVCLWGRDANGKLKGSCRSDGSLSLADLFANTKDAFEECGGHAHSGGFSVSHESVHTLQEVLQAAATTLTATTGLEKVVQPLQHDAIVTLPQISWELYKSVSQLAPFGSENPKPVLNITNTSVASIKKFGKEQNHVEVMLTSKEGKQVRAFDFFKSPEQFSFVPQIGNAVQVMATLERDAFRGPARLALRLIDILPA